MLLKGLAAPRILGAVIAAVLLTTPALAVAQTVTGTLQGTVVDTNGGVLPGAAVSMRNTETGQARDVVTNEKGFYAAPFLPIGRYRATASLSGFGRVTHERIDVTLNNTSVVDFTLSPRVAEEVTVTAERPSINTTNAEIKGSLGSEQILDKPTASPGSFLSLAEIFTGFQENPTSGQNNPTTSSGSSINFNGTGTRGATFQINGVNNDDSSENQNRQGAALSTIQEFQVITNNFTAEFGRGYGAVVLVQTKSGTNAVHGDAYEYYQNGKLNARRFNFGAAKAPKPVSRRHQYGFTLGFPIERNRLFGFLSFDQTRLSGEQNYVRDIFLASELALPRLTRGNDTPENRRFIESVLARFPSSLVPNDPRSNRTVAGIQGLDFPDRDYSGRLDWEPRSADHLTARWQYTRQIREPQDVIVGEQARQNNKQQNVGVTWTHVFSSATVAEARYGLGLRSTHVDITAGNDTPIIRFTGSPVSGSIVGNAGAFPISREQTDHQFVGNISTILGTSHSFKAGTDIRRQRLDDLAENFGRGFWNFRAACGGVTYPSAYAAFLDGCVSTFQKQYGPLFLQNQLGEYNFYAEDNWRVRPNFTLNLGVRYEYVGAPREVENRIDYEFGDDKDNVEPRLGFAWSPGGKGGLLGKITGGPGNSSIRGGYGIYHGRLFQSVFSQAGASVRTNPPNALFLEFNNVPTLADPTGGFVFRPGPQTVRHAETHVEPGLEMPYTHQWNLTYERKMPWNSTLRLSYAGNHGVGLLRYTISNLPVSPLAGGIVVVDHPNNAPAAGFPDLRGGKIDRIADDVLCAGTGFLPGINPNAQCPNPVPIANNEISFRVRRNNERRPDPRFTNVLLVSNGARSDYHGLQAEWTKTLSQGLQFLLSYSWSKAIDDTSEATFVGAGDTNQLGPDRKFARGLSRFDTRHRLTLNGSYRMPFFKDRGGFREAALGGWQVSMLMKLASGTPFTVVDTSGVDLNFDGFSDTRPVILDPSILGNSVDHPSASPAQLPRAAFGVASFGDYDKLVGRNTFFGDGYARFDFGLHKSFRMPVEGHRLVFRAELFNAFNHVQYGFPTADLASATFGRIVGLANTYEPRTLQFALRYQF